MNKHNFLCILTRMSFVAIFISMHIQVTHKVGRGHLQNIWSVVYFFIVLPIVPVARMRSMYRM